MRRLGTLGPAPPKGPSRRQKTPPLMESPRRPRKSAVSGQSLAVVIWSPSLTTRTTPTPLGPYRGFKMYDPGRASNTSHRSDGPTRSPVTPVNHGWRTHSCSATSCRCQHLSRTLVRRVRGWSWAVLIGPLLGSHFAPSSRSAASHSSRICGFSNLIADQRARVSSSAPFALGSRNVLNVQTAS